MFLFQRGGLGGAGGERRSRRRRVKTAFPAHLQITRERENEGFSVSEGDWGEGSSAWGTRGVQKIEVRKYVPKKKRMPDVFLCFDSSSNEPIKTRLWSHAEREDV